MLFRQDAIYGLAVDRSIIGHICDKALFIWLF